jgi:glycosyltransferase involved in cell wall biosynthesis
MSRKIVFVNQATGYLTIDIINSFARNFDKVAVISGIIRVQDIELDQKVEWSRIIKYDRRNPRKRLLSWSIGTFQILSLLLSKFRKYEVFYITIPPTAYLLSLLLPNKFSVLVFDVYPDVLKIHNHYDSGLIYRIWVHFNRKLFKKAHKVFTLGKGMSNLLAAYMPEDKINIVPLWTGLTKVKYIPKSENKWLANLELKEKFIIQYSGNIGYTHNVEVLIKLAIQLENEESLHFLIIGRGERYNHILSLIELHQLKNCTLLPFQPDNMLNFTLASADIGVVLLDERTAHVSLPSKIFNLQAVAIPILGISPLDSELNIHLTKYKNGRCFPQSDLESIADFIIEMKNRPDELRILADNSLKAAEFFTRDNADLYYNSY